MRKLRTFRAGAGCGFGMTPIDSAASERDDRLLQDLTYRVSGGLWQADSTVLIPFQPDGSGIGHDCAPEMATRIVHPSLPATCRR